MLENLIYIADRLDESGFYKKASAIDSIIKKISQINSEETIIFTDGDPEETDIIPELDPRKPNWRSYGESLMGEIRHDINEVFKDIDWEKLKRDWPGGGEDPILKHKRQAEKAINNRNAFFEYAFAIHYINPDDLLKTLEPDERKATLSRVQKLKKILSILFEEESQ